MAGRLLTALQKEAVNNQARGRLEKVIIEDPYEHILGLQGRRARLAELSTVVHQRLCQRFLLVSKSVSIARL